MKLLNLLLAATFVAASATLTSGCITVNHFDLEEATEVVEFADTVMTTLERHGVNLTSITGYVVELIEDFRKDDEKATPEEIALLIYKELTQ